MKKILISSFLVCIFMYSSIAQPVDRSHFITDSLDNYISTAIARWQIPGAAVCIVKDGKVINVSSG